MEEANHFVKQHELENTVKFVCYRKPKTFGDTGNLNRKIIYSETSIADTIFTDKKCPL